MTSMDMRMRILANATPAEQALSSIERTAKGAASNIRSSFHGIGKYILGSIGITGLALGIKSAIDSASSYNSALNLQSTILKNQITDKKTLATLDIKRNQYTNQWSSQYLVNMQNILSAQTAVSTEQIAGAQTALLSNKDMVNMFTKGAVYTKGIYKGMNKEFVTANLTALNLSAKMMAQMGRSGVGNPAMAVKAMNRALADPAKGLSAFSRFGTNLPQAEQNAIKAVEKHAKGAVTSAKQLNIARHMLIADLNKQSQGAAIAAATPMQLLQTMWHNLMTDFGQVFMPMLKGLSDALSHIAQPLSKIMQIVGSQMGSLMSTLGRNIGRLLTAFTPFLNMIVTDIVPMLTHILNPLVLIAVKVLGPIGKLMGVMVSATGPIGKAFTLIGNVMNVALTQAATALGNAFVQLTNSGAIRAIFDSMAQAMTIVAPVLPQLVKAFANLAVALAPISAKVFQGMADGMVAFAKLINIIAPLLIKVVNGITDLTKHSHGLLGVMALLAGVWFTRKMFLNPILAAGGAITGLIGKVGHLKESLGIVKTALGGGIGHGGATARLSEKAAAARAAREAEISRIRGLGSSAGAHDIARLKKLEGTTSRVEKAAMEAERAGKVSLLHGGGIRGMIKGLLGFGLSGGLSASPIADNQLTATNNLVQALNNLTVAVNSSGGILGGGGGGGKGLLGDAKKVEGLVGKSGRFLSKFGRIGGTAEGLVGTGGEAIAATEGATAIAAGAGETGTIMAAGAAGGLETAGISIAVAAAAAAYIKWHKAINHAVEAGAKHLLNGAKDVVKFGDKLAHGAVDVAGHVISGVTHVASSVVHGIASWLGFSGGSKPSSSGGHMDMKKFRFTSGALDVNIVSFANRRLTTTNLRGGFGAAAGIAAGMGANTAGVMTAPKGLTTQDLASITKITTAQPRDNIITIDSGAFSVTVQGSIDTASMNDLRNHVNQQFKELRYVLKTRGR